jgi:hypothetical protein
MFSAINKIGQTITPTNTTTPINKMDVTFRPLKQPSGTVNYVALIETDEKIIIEEDDADAPHEKLYNKGQIYATPQPPIKPDPFSLGNDPIKTFYIGSITVVGLFILYRMLTK